jgi:hypothetical protein
LASRNPFWHPNAQSTCLTKPSNSITITMNLYDFTFQKNMIFHYCCLFFRYHCLHCFVVSFCMDLGFVLVSFLASVSMFFRGFFLFG